MSGGFLDSAGRRKQIGESRAYRIASFAPWWIAISERDGKNTRA